MAQDRVANYRKIMFVLGIIFFIAGFCFLLVPDQIVKVINFAGRSPESSVAKAPVISGLPGADVYREVYKDTPPIFMGERSMPPHRLYITLAFTMMMMITIICFANGISPYRFHDWVPLLVFSKLCSSVTGLLVFTTSDFHYLADLIIFVVDFPLFVITLIVYLVYRGALAEGPDGSAI